MSGPEFANEPVLELRRGDERAALTAALADLERNLPLAVPVVVGGDSGAASGIESTDPGRPDRLVAHAAAAGAVDADAAVSEVAAAAREWRLTPAADRAGVLLEAAGILRRKRLELAALEVRECAKPWPEADADVCEAIDFLGYYARAAIELERGPELLQAPGERNSMRYLGRGVTAVISPWNFPIAIPAGMAGAALAAGNGVVLKPAEQAPGCALRLAEALWEAGVPPGALALLPGYGEAGEALVRHPGVATIAFTGSSAVGLEILRAAAEVREGQRQVKRVIAEMGGKNCAIVDADADLDEVVPDLIASAFVYAGQKCSACSRVLAHQAIAEPLVGRLAGAIEALLVGQAEDFGTDVPPLIEADARDRVGRYRGLADAEGTVVGGDTELPVSGWFCPPVLAIGLPPGSEVLSDEIFGPLLTIEPVASVEAACDIVEAVPFALTGALFSRDPQTIAMVTARSPVGNLYVNRRMTGAMVARQPFGGNRLSGVGSKAGGPDYLLQFADPHVVSENTMRHGLAVD